MRYKERKVRLYFRGDAAFASPEIYEYLEAEGLLYVIRLKANAILQRNIAHLLTRPVGRPPDHVRRFHASFSYQAGSWNKKRRVVAKVEWHPGELVPRVGFIVTNLSRPTKRVVAFYNHRGTAEQLSLPFISSAVETLEFCIPTGYLFRHAQDHQHAHLRLPRNRPWPRSALHRNPCPATAGSCPETEKAPAIASEGG